MSKQHKTPTLGPSPMKETKYSVQNSRPVEMYCTNGTSLNCLTKMPKRRMILSLPIFQYIPISIVYDLSTFQSPLLAPPTFVPTLKTRQLYTNKSSHSLITDQIIHVTISHSSDICRISNQSQSFIK